MSKPRYPWWGYVKNILRRYPNTPEREAVDATIEEYQQNPERLQVIDMVYFRKSHDMYGAAAACHVSYGAAKEWHGEFLRCVAQHLGLPM